MSGHVFISHSDKDKAVAELVVNALERRGIRCWVSPRDIPPGGSYADAILTAIEECSCFVLIYSDNSNSSGHVLREVERALKFDKNIVPLRFDNSKPSKSLDYLLASVHWLSAVSEPIDRAIAQAADRIASCVPASSEDSAGRKFIAVPDRVTTAVKAASSKTFFLWMFLIASICVVVVLTVVVLFRRESLAPPPVVSQTASPTIEPTPNLETPLAARPLKEGSLAEPVENLRRYFECFTQQDPAAAYDLLSTRFKAQLSFKKFAETFASTHGIRLVETQKITRSGNSATIVVSLEETDAQWGQVQWRGPISLVRESNGWRIDTMKELKRIPDSVAPGKN